MIYILLPLKYLLNDAKENRRRKWLNYGLYYLYAFFLITKIVDWQYGDILADPVARHHAAIVDSSSIEKPLSNSEKTAVMDSFQMEIKKPVNKY